MVYLACFKCILRIAGAQAGTVIAMPISGALADDVSWQSVFYFFGILGCIWFIFWLFLCFDSPATHPRISQVMALLKLLRKTFSFV